MLLAESFICKFINNPPVLGRMAIFFNPLLFCADPLILCEGLLEERKK